MLLTKIEKRIQFFSKEAPFLPRPPQMFNHISARKKTLN